MNEANAIRRNNEQNRKIEKSFSRDNTISLAKIYYLLTYSFH